MIYTTPTCIPPSKLGLIQLSTLYAVVILGFLGFNMPTAIQLYGLALLQYVYIQYIYIYIYIYYIYYIYIYIYDKCG